MARVLPSGRVFGEVHKLPNIQYAKGDDAFGRLEKMSESNLASIAVAGIDRIRKEIALSEAEEAEAKRLAETRSQLAELKGERSRWEAQKAREAEARQAPQPTTFTVPAAPAAAPAGQLFPSTRVEARGPLQRRGPAPAAHIEYNDPLVESMGGGSLEAGQKIIDEAHRRLAAKGLGPDDLGPSIRSGKYGIGPQTRAELELMVQEASQQPQAVVAEESIYASAHEQRLATINEQMAALQKQMQPMPTPRTGAEFIYAVMQETDPQRRKALLYQARNAIGDSPATIQEAIGGAATMRMQEKMLKGMSLADAAATAASEYNLKVDELKVKQRNAASKEKRETNYAKRVDSQGKRDQAQVDRWNREYQDELNKAARAVGASKIKHERRAESARIMGQHARKGLSSSEAKAALELVDGLSVAAIARATKAIDAKEKQWADEAKADASELKHLQGISSREAIAEANRKAAGERVERSAQIRAKAASDRANAEVELGAASAKRRAITHDLEYQQTRLRNLEGRSIDNPSLWRKAIEKGEGELVGTWAEYQKTERKIKALQDDRDRAIERINGLNAFIRGADAVINAPATEGAPPIVFGEPE